MSLPAPYQEHYYIGDGSTVEFSFGSDFTALASTNVKCIIYFSDGTNCTPTYTVDMTVGSITITTLTKPDGTVLTAPPSGSVVRVFRETPEAQNVTASQLQNYTAKQLEKIFDSMVAMTQETSYSDAHKSLRLTEPQRDVTLQTLSSDEDQGILYWDEESGTIKSTSYGQDELKLDVENAKTTASEAKTIAQTTQGNLTSHTANTNNPHQTSIEKLTDTNINNPSNGHFLMFNGTKWVNNVSSGTVGWGGILGNIGDQTDLNNTFVHKSGDTMTGKLTFDYGAGTIYKTDNATSQFNVFVNSTEFRIEHKYGSYNGNLVFRSYTGDATLYPNNDNRAIFGLPTRRWNKVYTTHLCSDSHGANVITIPDDKNDTLAVLGDVAFKSTDVTITSATAGQYLQYDGSKWVNATFSGANTDLSNLSAEGKKMLYHPELLSFQWSDHEIEDMSWLRADTFSWQSGTTYSEAYDHLVNDIDGKSLTSETISGTTVQFYLADDGHKICPASQESNVSAIYTATGVAWYYIIDTTNTRFKLPRTKFGMTGLRDTVGKYVEAGLPNITGSAEAYWESQNATVGAFYADTSRNDSERNNNTGNPNLGFDASRSSSIYGNSTTVQPPATQMYLYFYVGTFTQTALENTAGLNASLFNEKADVNLLNTANNVDFVIESQLPTAENNYTWYRKYRSGWVEQGGFLPKTVGDVKNTVVLPITMANSNYTIITQATDITSSVGMAWNSYTITNQTTTGFDIYTGIDWAKYWEVKGMAAS